MKKLNYLAACGLMLTAVLTFVSCSDDDEYTNPSYAALGIPNDDEATEAPVITTSTITLPNSAVAVKTEKGHSYLSIDMTGVWDETAGAWMRLIGTADKTKQNIWVTIDNTPKGIDVYNNADDNSRTMLADVVFLVDNSGSMNEEANAVANSIMAWSNTLVQSGLDINVGCVGYGDSNHAIDGGLNLTTPEQLKNYLDRSTGTNRTKGFEGNDAQTLYSLANISQKYENGSYNECGMVALHFAHDNYNFRGGANRIYVNFTDEPNQPNGVSKWSVEYLNPENNYWKTNNGTIHTVYSGYERDDNSHWSAYDEKPWLMSVYTGGTNIFTDNHAANWDLTTLPVTGAMQNSAVIRCTNLEALKDGAVHNIKITVQSLDKNVRAEKVIRFNFTTGQEE